MTLKRNPYTLFAAVLALAAIGVGFYTTHLLGAGVSGDAAKNLAVAANLLAGRGFVEYNLSPLLWWPPLYPTIIAAISLVTRLDILTVGWILNIVLLGLNIWLAAGLFERAFREQIIVAYLATLTTAISLSFFRISINIASDPLFFTLLIGFFLSLDTYLQTKNTRWLWVAALITALAGLQRYVGLMLIPTFALVELLDHPRDLGKALKHIIAFSISSGLPLGAWVVFHNYRLSGTLIGTRDTTKWLPHENLLDSLWKVINWFFPLRSISKNMDVDESLLLGLSVGVLLLGFASLLFLNRGERLNRFYKHLKDTVILPAVLFLVIYQLLLVFVINTEDHTSFWSDRYQLAEFYSLILIIGLILQDLVLPNLKINAKVANGLLVGGFLIWAAKPVNRLAIYVNVSRLKGDTTYNIYNLPQIANAKVVINARRVYKDVPDAFVFSNYGGALWLQTRQIVLGLPRLDGTVGLETLRRDKPVYIVWFIPNENDYIYEPEALSQYYHLEVVTADEDGIIYLIPPSK
jgi:hypothetical protein